MAKRNYWMTKGGVLLVELFRVKVVGRNGKPAWKIEAYRLTGGRHGRIWLHNLTRVQVEDVTPKKKGAGR